MSKTTWETTSVQNLLRNGASGRYYARWTLTVNGKSKQRWVNLDADVFSVAKLRIHGCKPRHLKVGRNGKLSARIAVISNSATAKHGK